MSLCKFQLTHPTSDESVSADFDLDGTPGDLVQQLQSQNWLTPLKDGSYAVVVTKENRTLSERDSFAQQNVADGAELSFRVRAVGAAPRRVGPSDDRLRLDYESLKDVEGRGCFGQVDAFASRNLSEPITTVEDALRMRCYTAELKMRLPISRDRFDDNWRVVIDLESDWNHYPSADYKPAVRFQGQRPWHYRLSPGGTLCTRPIGDAGFVCGQHLGVVAGLLNADEAFEISHDHGYDSEIYNYFRETFNGPVNPGLVIPAVREHVIFGGTASPLLTLARTRPTTSSLVLHSVSQTTATCGTQLVLNPA